ncbi:hypothetical protein [Aliiglaciecola litoralis]|uniref:hypothetical protein n=1 Tax=Aliiglaciecola litoralis TaxID=582857 RepID=UPI0031CDFD29
MSMLNSIWLKTALLQLEIQSQYLYFNNHAEFPYTMQGVVFMPICHLKNVKKVQ